MSADHSKEQKFKFMLSIPTGFDVANGISKMAIRWFLHLQIPIMRNAHVSFLPRLWLRCAEQQREP